MRLLGALPLPSAGVAVLRLFAGAREAAGVGRDVIDAESVAGVLAEAVRRYGDGFTKVLGSSKVWLDGEPALGPEPTNADSEVAVLPPVSGGV